METDFKKELVYAVNSALIAGIEVRSTLMKLGDIRYSGVSREDLVTKADLASLNSLRRGRAFYPVDNGRNYPFFERISEEETHSMGEMIFYNYPTTFVEAQCFPNPRWCDDEVDGTTNLSRGMQYWCISRALVVSGEPVLGVVYTPETEEIFFALEGEGAFYANLRNCTTFRHYKELTKPRHNLRQLHVSERDLEESVVIIDAPAKTPDQKERARRLSELLLAEEIFDWRKTCSAALDICQVAAGRAEAYVCPAQSQDAMWNNPWDIAAAMLILKEAGGQFSDFQGENKGIYTLDRLGTNELVRDKMIKLIQKYKI